MARMIPPVFDETLTVSPGERKLFKLLEGSSSTEGWVVLHSQRIARPKRKERGEADFVVIVPGRGVLVLEVKAHMRIARHQGLWLYGSELKPGKDPFQQAEIAMRAVNESVSRGMAGTGRRVLFADAVVFTHVDEIPSAEEWKARQVIDARSVTADKLAAAIERSLDSAAHELKKAHGMGDWTLTLDDVETVLRILRPEFDVTLSPAARRSQHDDELVRFTREQFVAIDAMAANRRVLFEGPAGTGKTLLAIEATIRAVDRGERAILLCHNAALAKHLAAVVEGRDSSGSLVTGTLHRFLMDLTGLKPPQRDGLEHDFFAKRLPEAALARLLDDRDAVAAAGFLFDTVVVDELQDLASEEFLVLLPELLRSEEGQLIAFGDLENQAIFNQEEPSTLRHRIELILDRPAVFRLLMNCRNTPRVVSWVTGLVDVTPSYSGIRRPDDGRDPELVIAEPENQRAELLRLLSALLHKGYRADEIIVLSVVGQEHSLARQVDDAAWAKRLLPVEERRGNAVGYTSVYRFKGLESRVVVLTDVAIIDGPFREALYVGLTRATERVFVVTTPGVLPLIFARVQRSNSGALA